MHLYFLSASKNKLVTEVIWRVMEQGAAYLCIRHSYPPPPCCDPADSRRPKQPLHDVILSPQLGAGAPRSVGQPNAGEIILLEVWPEHAADRAAALGPAS